MNGTEFRERRQTLGLSQRAIGERLGVTRMTVYYWERGVYPVPPMAELALRQIESDAAGTVQK